jgi:hypothetical protein
MAVQEMVMKKRVAAKAGPNPFRSPKRQSNRLIALASDSTIANIAEGISLRTAAAFN